MELSKRMQAVAAMVPRGSVAADVGCDHGFISIWLVQNGVCPHVYAADVRTGPLSRAKEHILQYGLGDYITPVLSDGLKNVPAGAGATALSDNGQSLRGADLMIAAGMGGKLTVRILREAPEKTEFLHTLVLEPQSEVWLVRRWLEENLFFITDEDIVVEDGKYYPVIKALHAGMEGTAEQVAKERRRRRELEKEWEQAGGEPAAFRPACEMFGPCLMKKKPPVFLSFLEHTIENDTLLLKRMPSPDLYEGEKAGRILTRRLELESQIAAASCARRLTAGLGRMEV